MTSEELTRRYVAGATAAGQKYAQRMLAAQKRALTDLRSHEPPRNSGEGTAVNGPMPLGEKDESRTAEPE